MTTRFVDRMAVEIDGDGDAVLMIHGLGGSSNVWTPVMPTFARCKTLRPDLPGSARSGRVEGPLSIERFVQAMLRAASAAGVERAHVVAHSLGTIVAFHLAAIAPSLVRSLALFGPLLAPADAIRPRHPRARREGAQRRRGGHAGDRERAGAGRDLVRDQGETSRHRGARAGTPDAPAARRLRAHLRRARGRSSPPTRRRSTARPCSSPATRMRSRRLEASGRSPSGCPDAGSRSCAAVDTGRR